MKKIIYLLVAVIPLIVFSQKGGVGINKSIPNVTLDISSSPDKSSSIEGFLLPRISGTQLKTKNALYTTDQNGTILFASTPLNISETDDKTVNVLNSGYYYFDSSLGIAGRWIGFVTEKPFTGFKSNDSQYAAYELNTHPDNDVVVKFSNADALINQCATYDSENGIFNLLYDGMYEMSGTICFNPGRANNVNEEEGHGNIAPEERIVIDINMQFSTDNGNTWTNFNGIRKSYDSSNADLSQPNSTPLLVQKFTKGTLIRMVIRKPDGLNSVEVAGTDATTGIPTEYQNINTPVGLDFTKLIRIMKLK